ncbi:amino acid ABC transporter substrate-binding protein [Microbacterium oleivorans]|uniref:ABC transporter substrate-binding protein n=1 Tax=Microbacterium oleivorans TaxID=273677 RepID=UPI0010A4971D|nr:ABC transporter substrate-binding protein [Microbacterium oleivorans]THE08065.1 amino acid ABC transporter substrate-binding protein [Microbacterium oleivorans]
MSRRPVLRTALVASAAALALLLGGCASNAAPGAGSSAGATPSADDYVTPGKFTVATGETAYEPYVYDDKPESGEGFESAVAYAVADKLGFAKDDVEWVRTSFDAAIAPGPKSFDVNLQQYTITDDRKKGVDFSSPYYSASQSIIALKGGKADGVKDLAELKDITIGAMANSTSALTLDALDLGLTPKLYNSNEDATAALGAGQVDAVVLDTPTAYVAVSAYIKDSFIVGELPKVGVEDQWGLLLAKDSPLTPAVSAAVDELREDGTLAKLEKEWLSGLTAGVTKLQ